MRVFLDCDDCDGDYVRREIEFIDYVRDRKEADLHILVTTQDTASGGEEWVFKFIGLGRFDGVNDELKYTSLQTSTDDEERAGYTRVLKLGLVRYVTSTAIAEKLQVVYQGVPREKEAAAQARDRIRGISGSSGSRDRARFEREQREKAHNYSAQFSGNRVTEAWKINTSFELDFEEDHFTLSDGEKLVDKAHDHEANVLVVKSLGDHWAAAVRGRAASSTFLNQDRAYRVGAGVEYSVFPYRASATKELTAQLTLGVNHFDYVERNDLREGSRNGRRRAVHRQFRRHPAVGLIGRDARRRRPIFTISRRHRLRAGWRAGCASLQGVLAQLGGSVSRIRDQIYLEAGDATDEEILLRRRQLATDYRYEFSIGFSYTFGSIFNSIVNTRF